MRVVRQADGSLAVGRTLPGRGAWLCAGSPTCVADAVKRKALGRALRAEVTADAAAALAAGPLAAGAAGPGGPGTPEG